MHSGHILRQKTCIFVHNILCIDLLRRRSKTRPILSCIFIRPYHTTAIGHFSFRIGCSIYIPPLLFIGFYHPCCQTYTCTLISGLFVYKFRIVRSVYDKLNRQYPYQTCTHYYTYNRNIKQTPKQHLFFTAQHFQHTHLLFLTGRTPAPKGIIQHRIQSNDKFWQITAYQKDKT